MIRVDSDDHKNYNHTYWDTEETNLTQKEHKFTFSPLKSDQDSSLPSSRIAYTAKINAQWNSKKPTTQNKVNKYSNLKVGKRPSESSLDSKIGELVSSTKNNPYNSVDVSYVRRPNLGAKKASKNKQPSQVSGFYKKPSLMSNFSMNLGRPEASVSVYGSVPKSNSVLCKNMSKVDTNFTRNGLKFIHSSDSLSGSLTARNTKINNSFKSETKLKPNKPILQVNRSREFKSPDAMSVTGKQITLNYRLLLWESFEREVLKRASY